MGLSMVWGGSSTDRRVSPGHQGSAVASILYALENHVSIQKQCLCLDFNLFIQSNSRQELALYFTKWGFACENPCPWLISQIY